MQPASSTALRKLVRAAKQLRFNLTDNRRISYSQTGEDLLVRQVFTMLGQSRISYLDLGANHPTRFSNTYLFYRDGSSGVSVEPDPAAQGLFRKWRPRDTLLCCGVGLTDGAADFYVMTTNTLNTFSREEALRYQGYGNQEILETIKVPLKPVNAILERHFRERCPNFISLDIEGMDLEILKTLDFQRFRPEVFCIETLTYTEDKTERKLDEIIEYMKSKDYTVYADTYINTIFVDRAAWQRRK